MPAKTRFITKFAQCDCPVGGVPVTVNSLAGELCQISLHCEETVADAKSKIEAATGTPSWEQRLLSGRELEDSMKIGSHLQTLIMIRRDPEQAHYLRAIAAGTCLLSQAPEHIRGDREVVLAALRVNPMTFAYASEELKQELAEAVVQQMGGSALEMLPQHLRADRRLVLMAAEHKWAYGALEHAADCLKRDRDFVLSIIKLNPSLAGELPYPFCLDAEMLLLALQSKSVIPSWCTCCGTIVIPETLLHDRGFLRRAMAIGRHDVLPLAAVTNTAMFSDGDIVKAMLDHCDLEEVPNPFMSAQEMKPLLALKRIQRAHELAIYLEATAKELTELDLERRHQKSSHRHQAQLRKLKRSIPRKRGGRRKSGEGFDMAVE